MKISDLKQINRKSISNIIFDWGGVITELEFATAEKKFNEIGLENIISYFTKNQKTNFLLDMETGRITPEEFRIEIRKHLPNETSDEEIDDAWNSVLGDTPANRIATLKKLGTKYNLYLLSNTNKIHVDYFNKKLRQEQGVDHYTLFKKVYYSHDLGARKPDAEFFRAMLADSRVDLQSTLFIDDLEANIDAAASLGIMAFHLTPSLDIADLFNEW